MKKAINAALALLVLIASLSAAMPHARAAAVVTLKVTASPESIASGGTVDLNIDISVGSGGSGEGITNVELYLEGGSTPLSSWSRIGAGGSVQSILPNLFIPPSQLGVPYPVVLSYVDFDGTPQSAKGSFTVYEGAPPAPGEVRLSFSRSASVKSVLPGGTVSLTYTLRNDGAVTVTQVEISDEPHGQVAQIPSLAPGQSESYVVSVRAAQDILSAPLVVYTNSNTGERMSKSADPLTIPIANPKLTVSLKADATSIKSGETVNLTCTVFNEGNVPFSDVQISEESLGMMQGISLLEPGKSYVCNKKASLVNSAEYTFLVTAQGEDGNPISIQSNAVSVMVEDALVDALVDANLLALRVTSDSAQLSEPGTVNFSITVSNRGSQSIQSLTLSEAEAGTIQRMDTLPPGDKMFPYKAQVNVEKGFTFIVEGLTADGQRLQATSDTILILMQQEPSATPIWQTPAAPDQQAAVESQLPGAADIAGPVTRSASSGLLVALIVVIVLIALCVIVLIALFLRDRAQRRAYAQTLHAAYDHSDYHEYPEYPSEPRYPDRPDEDEEVTRPVAPRRRPPAQEDPATRPVQPRRRR